MASPIFQMRLDSEQRARWEAATRPGEKLAEFIREAVEEKIARAAEPDAPVVPSPPVALGRPAPSSGKRSYARDPKGGKEKK